MRPTTGRQDGGTPTTGWPSRGAAATGPGPTPTGPAVSHPTVGWRQGDMQTNPAPTDPDARPPAPTNPAPTSPDAQSPLPVPRLTAPRRSPRRVVVVGAGLAGLTAAATAARAGAEVTILDTREPGGRARTDAYHGFLMNQGPHALYRGGPGRRVLSRLGIHARGHLPRFRGARGLLGDRLVPLPVLPAQLARGRAGHQVAGVLARLATTNPASWAGHSARQWIDHLDLRPASTATVEALVRVSSYVADLDRMPADLALGQMRSGLLHGVTYLDGGWTALVDGVSAAATAAGAVVRDHEPAIAIAGEPGDWQVVTSSETVLPAQAVVLAAGGPDTARRLLPLDPGWGDLGPPVTAACLDLGLRGGPPPFVLGLDDPLYLSAHCPPGDLAPAGGSMVHVMRYGARRAKEDRTQLCRLAAMAGIADEAVAHRRFLARMVVAHTLPGPEVGLAGRPAVAVPGAEGLLVAGDWVGPVGWLADATLASGEVAGALAARAATSRPVMEVA